MTKSKNVLKEIWDLQVSLMNMYQERGMLKLHPLNLSDKDSAKIIRDVSIYLIEELAEYSKSIDLQGSSEEAADVLHFIFEVLIFSFDSFEEFENILIEESLGKDLTKNTLQSSSEILTHFVNKVSPERVLTDRLNITLGNGIRTVEEIGVSYSPEEFLWPWLRDYMLTLNLLKAKPWRVSSPVPPTFEFKKRLAVLAFFLIYFILQMEYINLELMLASYKAKNEKNILRIKEKY